MTHLYVLKNGKPVPVQWIPEWVKWCKDHEAERTIEQTQCGPLLVSTVFLGTDYDFTGHGRALLYETAVISGDDCNDVFRYATLGEAKVGHFKVVEQVLIGLEMDQTEEL